MAKPTKGGRSYEVGYGKPPVQSRFQKGASGNPRGRPKGALNLISELNNALRKKVVVTENGKQRKATMLEVAIKGMVTRAVKGDAKAMQQILALGPFLGLEESSSTPPMASTDAAVLESFLKQIQIGPPETPVKK